MSANTGPCSAHYSLIVSFIALPSGFAHIAAAAEIRPGVPGGNPQCPSAASQLPQPSLSLLAPRINILTDTSGRNNPGSILTRRTAGSERLEWSCCDATSIDQHMTVIHLKNTKGELDRLMLDDDAARSRVIIEATVQLILRAGAPRRRHDHRARGELTDDSGASGCAQMTPTR